MTVKQKFEIAGRTDIGRLRKHNEDSIGDDPALGVAVIADGMGGYQGGEVASGIAVQTILDSLRRALPDIAHGETDSHTGYLCATLAVRQSIVQANDAIFQAASEGRGYHGMGTTLVMAVFHGRHVVIAHVGDSRLYRYRSGELKQLTLDHSLVQEMVNRGLFTREQARDATNRNLVTRALGIEASVAVDLQEEMVLPGDLYLLCSDGLNDMLNDGDIEAILSQYADNLELAAERLVMKANERGGKDNISVMLARSLHLSSSYKPWYRRWLGF